MADRIELAKGIVAGFAIDLVRGKTGTFIVGGLVVGVVGLVGALFFDGVGAAGLGLVAAIGFVVTVIAWITRFLLTRAIRLVADPAPDPEQRVRSALEDADLPTGPISVARLLVRLRRDGADDEIDRLRGVLAGLSEGL